MKNFVGRDRYLSALDSELSRVKEAGEGRFVLVRGRRQVGKSTLVERFLERSGAAHIFFTATRRPPARELEEFVERLASSRLPAAGLARSGVSVGGWEAALSLAASSATRESPAVLVLDEFPYLAERDEALESVLQKVWDRELSRSPVLLVVIGSDLAMMEALTSYERPLYGRPSRQLIVEPFDPRETGELLGVGAVEAMEARLVSGGFPGILGTWRRGESLLDVLRREVQDTGSALVRTGERAVEAELPEEYSARQVLTSVGHGERTFVGIERAAGIPHASVQRSLGLLTEKRLVNVERPLAVGNPRNSRYHVADSYLRFWLRFIGPYIPEIERGRGDLVYRRIERDWAEYRGRAAEPLVRESVERLLADEGFRERLRGAWYVGSYWTRNNEVEVDLVGADRERSPARICFCGSIKWRETVPFGRGDLGELRNQASRVPGADGEMALVGVSRSGFVSEAEGGLDAALAPDDLVAAW